MAYICTTDEAYMRDFYHYVLRGHIEGFGIVTDKGFEWNVAGGGIKSISVKYQFNQFWYELGNNPDYLSSRKIYYYRAWVEYYVEGPLIKTYGAMKQFTSINPNCTGFTNFNAKKEINKYYSYHGGIMACKIQTCPAPLICVETIEGEYIVVTFDYHDVEAHSANLEGVLIVAEGVGNFISRGFLYGPTEEYGEYVQEDGSFPAGNYTMHIIY